MRNWFRNLMVGRYGPDQLYNALFIVSVALGLISIVTSFRPLYYVALVILAISVARVLSRNTGKRRQENDRFLALWRPLKYKITMFFRRLRDRKHYRFFRCPSCKNKLRVPKGKGRIQITCPRCGERFIKKT